jgi:transcriptional regulator with XRE-family HTH domain
VRNIEQQLIDQVMDIMQARRVTQSEFAASKGITRQTVNPYFTGKKSLLTETGKDILEFLGVRIKLEVIEDGQKATTRRTRHEE